MADPNPEVTVAVTSWVGPPKTKLKLAGVVVTWHGTRVGVGGTGVLVGVGADTFTVHVAYADSPLRSARTKTVFNPLVL